MQVVKLNMTNINHQCPPGTTLRTELPRRLCGIGISRSTLLGACNPHSSSSYNHLFPDLTSQNIINMQPLKL